MTRPADMTERQLADALHAVNEKLCSPALPDRAHRLLRTHQDRLAGWLSLRIEDRAEAEEQRR